jgi:hypothetical protein
VCKEMIELCYKYWRHGTESIMAVGHN